MDDRYLEQVRLLVDVLPHLAKEEVFALKGGTAINLFYRDMPRLSVDIDLTYVPIEDRDVSLKHMDETLERIMGGITAAGRAQARRIAGGGTNETRILVSDGPTRVKIETSPVARGTVLPPRTMVTCDAVTDRFGFAEMPVLAFEDLFGGKLHAALDRQHPRDLFDIKLLYENEGLTDDLFRVFMVYVASSARPMHELLAPGTPPSEHLFDAEFAGMTRDRVTRDMLDEARARLHSDVRERLTGRIAEFLLSVHDAKPDFERIGLPGAARLPAVRWKRFNLEKLKRENAEKHAKQRNALEALLG
ncbi:MAG TPA: nucleotidyl transferase AbiEii/AbiGii toxin family protein [Gammaproteobacteria bacterium]|nr:nucleotidyl transferase AbiEii/AbiGii toxin family protein [Gammaproteobacteria bacterium]